MANSRLGRHVRGEAVGRWQRLVMVVLASVGAVDTGLITLKSWQVIPQLVCPVSGDGCERVLSSSWGTVFGQPLALYGFVAYATVVVLALLPLLSPLPGRRALNGFTWPLLLLQSTGMTVFSLSLMGLMVWEIKAFCFFCLLSAALSLLLLLVALFGRQWEDMGPQLFRMLIVALVVAVGSQAWINLSRPGVDLDSNRGRRAPLIRTPSNASQIALAEHLRATGAVIYTAYWCPACRVQKELFGKEAARKLPVVECAADGYRAEPERCETREITSYPTWEIDGVLLTPGIYNPDDLADSSGYEGARNFPVLPNQENR